MPSRRSAMASNITPPSEVGRPPSKSAVIFRPRMARNANGDRIVGHGGRGRCANAWSRHPSLRKIRDLDHARQPLVHRSMNKTGLVAQTRCGALANEQGGVEKLPREHL